MHVWMLTQERDFETQEELEAALSKFMIPGEKPNFPEPTQPWHKAQDLVYEGWDEEAPPRRRKTAHEALKISPDAVDAYLLLAHDADTWNDASQLCQDAVAAGERLIEPFDFFAQDPEAFWNVVITRPYMRARFALGYTLWRQDRRDEARVHFDDLLELNPNDNQGARYVLVALYLEEENHADSRRVMDTYSPDSLCYWDYNRALWHFQRRGDAARAEERLEQAIESNPQVPEFLLDDRAIPSRELMMVVPGEESEAIEYVQIYRRAWTTTSGALDWLREVSSTLP